MFPERNSGVWMVVDEIVEYCTTHDQKVPEELVALTMKYVYQHRQFGFHSNDLEDEGDVQEALDPEEVRRLAAICKEKLLNDRKPLMETLRMQVEFANNYQKPSETATDHRRVMEARLGPLTREITQEQGRTKADLDRLYRKMVTLVTLRAGQGNPTDAAVLREATAALTSVFPQTELPHFVAQSWLDKRARLRELSGLVSGLRVYNWDARKGGAGMKNLPEILSAACDAALANLDAAEAYTAEKAHQYTAVTEHLLYTEAGSQAVSSRERETFKAALILIRQFQNFLAVIAEDVRQGSERVSRLDQDLLQNLTELQRSLATRLDVPSAEVFPQFAHLAKIWQGFQDEMVHLNKLNALKDVLQRHMTCLSKMPLKRLMSELNIRNIPSDEERSWVEGSISLDDLNSSKCVLIAPAGIGDIALEDVFARLDRRLAGFCPVALVSGAGFIVPGNPRLGLLRFEGRHYVCSTVDRAREFAKNPDMFVQGVKRLLHENPSLEKLMLEDTRSENTGLSDASVQTCTHPMPPTQDPSYHWNEWDMRREALKLTKLSRCKTTSAQTDVIRWRKEETTQIKRSQREPEQWSRPTITVQTARNWEEKKKSIVVGLKSRNGSEVEHVLLEDLLARI